MKKLLSILSAVGLTATAGSAVVACGSSQKDTYKPISVVLFKGQDWSFENLINAMTDSQLKEVEQTLLGKTDISKADFIAMNNKSIAYQAITGLKITEANHSKSEADLSKEYKDTIADVNGWQNIQNDGRTYQIGIRTANGVDGDLPTPADQSSAKWFWVNLEWAEQM